MTETARHGGPYRGTFPNAWTLLRIRGVPVRVDVSWVLIVGLVLWVLFERFEALLGDRGPATVVGSAGVAALLFFASLLAHELGHAITSLNRDIPVMGITLFMMGGVTESTREAQTARDEFVIVGIGPFISLVLAAMFGLVYVVVQRAEPAAAVAGHLAWINLALAVFNVLPGYPLDGGRLLRSLLWMATGRPHRSTRWAARVGQVFALGLIAAGLWGIADQSGFGGLWEVLIGFFLLRGATQSYRRAGWQERFTGSTAREYMGSLPPLLDPAETLDRAIERVQTRPSLVWPVGSPLRGGVTLAGFDRVPQTDWASTPVRDIAYDGDEVTVSADETMDTVMDRLAAAPERMLIVVDGGHPVGLLTPSLVAGLGG